MEGAERGWWLPGCAGLVLRGEQDPHRYVEQELRAREQAGEQEDDAHGRRGGAEASCQRGAHSADHAAVGGSGERGHGAAPSRASVEGLPCGAFEWVPHLTSTLRRRTGQSVTLRSYADPGNRRGTTLSRL